MSRLTKTLLVAAIVNLVAAALFLTGIMNINSVPGLYVTFPVAVVLFGVSILSRAMQKEVAKFDAEQREHPNHVPEEHDSKSGESVHGHEYYAPYRI